MRVLFLMKDDYDVVSAEIGAWLHCCVTGSRLFAAKLLLIVMLPLRVGSGKWSPKSERPVSA
jgi:hypothetical protein